MKLIRIVIAINEVYPQVYLIIIIVQEIICCHSIFLQRLYLYEMRSGGLISMLRCLIIIEQEVIFKNIV